MEKSARKRRAARRSKAKKIEGSEPPEVSYNDDNESNESVSSDMELQVEFEGKAILEQDFDGIRQLLHQLFLKADVNIDELVELIISQNNVGSTIKLCAGEEEEEEKEEEQVCGIATVINLTFHKEKSCAMKLMAYLLNQSKEHSSTSEHTQFSQLLEKSDDRQLGLLVNARFLNIPPHLVVPLFKSLRSEMEEACEKGLPYNFQHFVVVARSHQAPVPQQPKKTKKARMSGEKGELLFDHFEFELMHQESIASFSYPVSEDSDSVIGGTWSFDDQEMKPFRTVMVIPATVLEKVVITLESAL